MTTFAERLKFLRKREKLTQKQLAEKLGVKQGSYSNWENGNREPNLTTLSDIAFLLDTTLDFLLGYSDTDDYTIFEEEKLNNLDRLIDKAVATTKQKFDDIGYEISIMQQKSILSDEEVAKIYNGLATYFIKKMDLEYNVEYWRHYPIKDLPQVGQNESDSSDNDLTTNETNQTKSNKN